MTQGAVRCAALWISVALISACGSSDAPRMVAELAHAEKQVDAEHGGSWTTARVGERFAVGDAVRTGSGAAARLALPGGGGVRLGEATLLRFTRGRDARTRIAIETGEAETEGGDGDYEVDTEVGPARIERGTRLRLAALDRGTRVEVVVGRAVIQKATGEDVAIEAGHGVLVTVGGAQIEPLAPPPEPAPPEPPVIGDVAADVRGRGAEARPPGARDWQPLEPGKTRLPADTEVRLPKRTSIDFTRGDERATVEGPAEIVLGKRDGALLDARRGTTILRADDDAVTIAVPGGTITARRGTRAEVSVGDRGSAIEVARGAVDAGGDTVRPGERALLDRKGGVTVSGRTAATADLTIPAGESATIHDPRRRTSVRIRFGDVCGADGGLVELADESFRRPEASVSGTDAAVVVIRRGSRKYRVRCRAAGELEAEPRASGTLRVTGDSGTAPLPQKPPANVIDADGRHYTVLYQNLLPALTLRWPSAPAGSTFELHLQARGGTKSVQTSAATHTFSSGDVKEGTYTWWFSSGSHQSPKTRLSIDFDNAAAAAQVVEPRDGGAWSDRVKVKGTVSEGWKASAGGTPLTLDTHRRFEAELSLPADEEAMAVRLEHPSRGVHYYVRRPSR